MAVEGSRPLLMGDREIEKPVHYIGLRVLVLESVDVARAGRWLPDCDRRAINHSRRIVAPVGQPAHSGAEGGRVERRRAAEDERRQAPWVAHNRVLATPAEVDDPVVARNRDVREAHLQVGVGCHIDNSAGALDRAVDAAIRGRAGAEDSDGAVLVGDAFDQPVAPLRFVRTGAAQRGGVRNSHRRDSNPQPAVYKTESAAPKLRRSKGLQSPRRPLALNLAPPTRKASAAGRPTGARRPGRPKRPPTWPPCWLPGRSWGPGRGGRCSKPLNGWPPNGPTCRPAAAVRPRRSDDSSPDAPETRFLPRYSTRRPWGLPRVGLRFFRRRGALAGQGGSRYLYPFEAFVVGYCCRR